MIPHKFRTECKRFTNVIDFYGGKFPKRERKIISCNFSAAEFMVLIIQIKPYFRKKS